MDYNKIAKRILNCVGGESNVVSLMYCVTRLRFDLQDERLADTEELKKTKGVIGVLINYGQYQVVIGNGVNNVYTELNHIGNFDGSFEEKEDKNILYRSIKAIGKFFTSVIFRNRAKKNDVSYSVVYAPIKGRVIRLNDVADRLFAEGDFGEGAAIIPETNLLASPVDGRIISLTDGMNTVAVMSNNGTEILMHIGIDTVNLNGKYFNSYVEEGDFVRMGDPLIEFDANLIAEEGYDLTTLIAITNSTDYEKIDVVTKFAIEQNPFIKLINKREEYAENK